MALEYQIIIIFAATRKLLLDIQVDKILEFQDRLFKYIENNHSDILNEIRDKKVISDELSEKLIKAIENCKKE